MTSARAHRPAPVSGLTSGSTRTTPRPRPRPPARTPSTTDDVIDLQKSAGNKAVSDLIRPVQRVGGWTGADAHLGKGVVATDPQTGWNVEEHAVGNMRRIPVDGLVGGLRSDPGESKGAETLTNEKVVGPVTGAPRSDAAEQKGRGRAIALVHKLINPKAAVQVMFHLHGNTENASRAYAGWRQHEKSGEVRDVARDEIGQQIDGAKNPQLIGILPQGVNSSDFGSINPDKYIADVFDRLTEIGAWTAAPPKFSVVLSAHSGSGFLVERLLSGKLPADLDTLVLFEAIHVTASGYDQVPGFGAWIEKMIGDNADFLNSTKPTPAEKQDRLDHLTKVRLVWDPADKGYNGTYTRLETRILKWFDANKSRLGSQYQMMRDLVTFERIAGVGHEGLIRAGLGKALGGTAGTGSPAKPPAPAKSPPTTGASPGAPIQSGGVQAGTAGTSWDDRVAAISARQVAAQAAASPLLAAGAFQLAVFAGAHRLKAAAMALSTFAPRSEMDLTDALFALVHPELGGGRIPAARTDLASDWKQLRKGYARPAQNSPAPSTTESTTVGEVSGKPTTTTTPDAPTPTPPTTSAPETIDPTTVKPAKAATGKKELTADEQKAALAGAIKQVTKSGAKADRDAVANTLLYNGFKPEDWFGKVVFNATFLDVPIQPSGGTVPGVHPDLLTKLDAAEAELIKRFPGLSKAQIATKMGIYEISGIRPPKKATGGTLPSYHCFGLAVDINHPTNPFVGNMSPTLDANRDKKVSAEEQANYDKFKQNRSPRIIERAMLLLRGEKFDIENMSMPSGKGAAGKLWEIHHRASETLAEYLRLADDVNSDTVTKLIDARRAAGDTTDWRKQIVDDRAVLPHWDFMHHKAPQKGGYMDLAKELIEALAGAGLLWGGSYGGAKDMMHFDFRKGFNRPPKGWTPPAT